MCAVLYPPRNVCTGRSVDPRDVMENIVARINYTASAGVKGRRTTRIVAMRHDPLPDGTTLCGPLESP